MTPKTRNNVNMIILSRSSCSESIANPQNSPYLFISLMTMPNIDWIKVKFKKFIAQVTMKAKPK